jgi:hypothetical protein
MTSASNDSAAVCWLPKKQALVPPPPVRRPGLSFLDVVSGMVRSSLTCIEVQYLAPVSTYRLPNQRLN